MKKVLSLFLAILLIFAAGCANKYHLQPKHQHPNETQSQSNQQVSQQLEQPDTQSPSYSDQNNFIGEQKAKEIALDKAGLNESEVIFEKIKLDFDDRVYQYEIEFRKGKTEYNAEIKADDGTVIGWEIDFD